MDHPSDWPPAPFYLFDTVGEFCAIARMGRTEFYREVSAGRLSMKRVGRRHVVDAASGSVWFLEHFGGNPFTAALVHLGRKSALRPAASLP